MRSFARTHRGLSTVITTAIMLTAVAVIGSAVVSWSNGNLKAFETNLASSSSDKTSKINENLLIENIIFCYNCPAPISGKGVNITLTNVGYVGLNVTQIQINGSSFSWKISPPISILPKVSTLYQKSLPTWKSSSLETITVTTARGSIYTKQVTAP